MNQPLVIAHRGASAAAPENTLAAIRLAWELGADGIEFDIQLTGDGEIVVIHDQNTERTTGIDRKVRTTPLIELKQLDAGSYQGAKWKGETIPTLREVLAETPDGKLLMIEIKETREIIEPLKKLLAENTVNPEQIVLMAFDYDLVVELKGAFPQYPILWISGVYRRTPESTWTDTTRDLIAKIRDANLDGLSLGTTEPFNREAFEPHLRLLQAARIPLYYWTHNNPEHARWFIDRGCSGVMTDVPERFLRSA